MRFNKGILFTATSVILVIYIITHFQQESIKEKVHTVNRNTENSYQERTLQGTEYFQNTNRDFYRYNCDNQIRIGGLKKFLDKAPDELYRVEGSWILCFDYKAKPQENSCNVLSFGIRDDDSFDEVMNNKYGCNVYSFDPFVEPPRVKDIRAKINSESSKIEINKNWYFFNLGITHLSSNDHSFWKRGSMVSLEEIISEFKLENQTIDVLKMDIEGGEFDVFKQLNIDYVCKYVKQITIETHPSNPNIPTYKLYENFKSLARIEACFLLFYRHTRFYMKEGPIPTGWASEWEVDGGFQLDIKKFANEIDIASYMYLYGELSFVNRNYLKNK